MNRANSPFRALMRARWHDEIQIMAQSFICNELDTGHGISVCFYTCFLTEIKSFHVTCPDLIQVQREYSVE